MNTGGGKTVVGLLILKSCLNEKQGPAVYAAPDNYLVSQVMDEASGLGIPVVKDPKSPRFLSGQAILVCPIHTVFNGRSQFGTQDTGVKISIGSIVIDDAHAALTTVENQFSISLESDNQVFRSLHSLLKDDLKQQSPVAAVEVDEGDPRAVARVPFWAWSANQTAIIQTFVRSAEDESLMFSWPLLKNSLRYCHCVFAGDHVEICPHSPPIDVIPAFDGATRRIFMTATLADDTILVTSFGADKGTISHPITPSSASDLGDRIILAPQTINPNLTDLDIREFAATLAISHNVVVIVPSEYRAKFWENERQALLTAKNLHEGVERLKSGHVGLVVMLNKYDGVDLPDDACRILVIDGVPDARNLIEKIEFLALAKTKRFRQRRIQKIEQGMGRGVRATDDYCAVILMGSSLSQEMHSGGAEKMFSNATAAQLDLSTRAATQIEGKGLDAVKAAIDLFLSRDPRWVQSSKNALIDVRYDQETKFDPVGIALRVAFDQARHGRPGEAGATLRVVIDDLTDSHLQGWLLERVADYVNDIDKAQAQATLEGALHKNVRVLKPLAQAAYRRIDPPGTTQAMTISTLLQGKCKSAQECLIGINELCGRLVFDEEQTNDFEEAVKELGEFLGFVSQRPERKHEGGPDNLWALGNNNYLVIACKSGGTKDEIAKRYADQLSGSANWFRNHYDAPAVGIPLVVHPSRQFAKDAHPPAATRVIDSESLEHLKDAVKSFAASIADNFQDHAAIERSLKSNHLYYNLFVEKYSKPFRKAT